MKRTWIAWVAAVAVAGALQAQQVNRARAWFPDGTGLEIHTETTGSTGTNSAGEIGIGRGRGSRDVVNRVVIDGGNNILFAYNLEGSRGVEPGTMSIRIEPIGAATEAGILKRQATGLAKFPGGHLPTVATAREFPSVRIGEVLTLDILYNPSTGEKIYDVLRPITDPSPSPRHPTVTEVASHQAISLKDIVVKVNGRVMHTPASWIIGATVRIDIPGHGAYVVAVYDPQDSVSSIYPFHAAARADGKALSWGMDGDTVEITSSTNILTQAAKAVLWVYHDPRYRSQDQPNAVRLQAADKVEWLLPQR